MVQSHKLVVLYIKGSLPIKLVSFPNILVHEVILQIYISMLGAMSHPQLISSQLPEQNMSSLLNNGNSLADDFLAHEGMISTVLGDCIKEDGAVIGDKHEKGPLMGWGSMLEQVNI